MTEKNQTYKCNICGNVVEILHTGAGQLVCCGQPMDLLSEKKEDEGQEKHVPVIERIDGGVIIKIGAVPHPMEKEHYIEWIEMIINDKSCRVFLKPGNKPEAKFQTTEENISARAFCNIHGLWKS